MDDKDDEDHGLYYMDDKSDAEGIGEGVVVIQEEGSVAPPKKKQKKGVPAMEEPGEVEVDWDKDEADDADAELDVEWEDAYEQEV